MSIAGGSAARANKDWSMGRDSSRSRLQQQTLSCFLTTRFISASISPYIFMRHGLHFSLFWNLDSSFRNDYESPRVCCLSHEGQGR